METTLRRAVRGARARHPTHVRTGSILHLPLATFGPVRAIPRQRSSKMLSGWMSIFAPVSLAASRAFWPSLPIASDS